MTIFGGLTVKATGITSGLLKTPGEVTEILAVYTPGFNPDVFSEAKIVAGVVPLPGLTFSQLPAPEGEAVAVKLTGNGVPSGVLLDRRIETAFGAVAPAT